MTTFTATVELFVDGAWLDITKIDAETKVLAAGGLTINRGRSDQQGRAVTPTEVRFTYLDNNALLDGDNPASPYWRKIGLGTPMRVKVDGEVRASVELVSMEPSWDEIDSVVKVSVVGAGMMRRLEDALKPLRSPAYRALTSAAVDSERVAYWPVEEESGATTVFSPYISVNSVGIRDMQFGAYTDSPASARMATFGPVGQMFFVVPFYSSTEHKVVSLWKLPDPSLPAGTKLMRLYCTGGNVEVIDLEYGVSLDGSLRLVAYNAGVVVDTANFVDWSSYIVNEHFALSLEFTQDGADLDNTVFVVPQDPSTNGASAPDTLTGVTIGRIYAIVAGESSCEGASFGHLVVGNDTAGFATLLTPVTGNALAVRGYTGEPAGSRIERLAEEDNLPITVVGTASDSEPVGPQDIQTSVNLVYDASDTDMGILFEARTALELEYRTRVSLYNQAPTASLSYNHLSKGFRPAADDLRVVNAVTAQRDEGGTAYYAIPDGDYWHWTTQDPPDGAGLRDTEITPSVDVDDQLITQAAWTAHQGSWREKRFPAVPVELARDDRFDAADRAAVRALDIGDMLTITTTGAPNYVPYNEIRLIVQGYTETVSKHLHSFTFNTTQADVYEVEMTDTGGSTLVAAIDDNDTTLKLATSLGPEWSTSDEPYHIQIDGQPMTVTTMTTDTPAFIAAGTVAHGNNASVAPGLPAGMTPDVGQIMLCWAAIRNSGTGTVGTNPTGWTTLVDFGNCRLMYRYYVTGDAAPTVTFSGGVANADTSARIVAFSGLSHEFASGTKATPAAATQLNSSAANMAYPALMVQRDGGVVLYYFWKQDDWTSVAHVGDAEMFDNATTTGDDQGIQASYDIYTTATNVAAGSVTVTGGASAISRAVVLALRPLQTATVTRGIAGTATSAAAGSAVHAWRWGVNGL